MASRVENALGRWSLRSPVDVTILLMIVSLTVTGILAVFSASWPVASRPSSNGGPGDPYQFLVSQTLYAVLGGVFCLLFAHLNPVRVGQFARLMLGLSLVLMVLVFTNLGEERGGARRWLDMGPLTFQPSEFAKLALILYLARSITAAKEWPRRQFRTYLASMVVTGVIAGLCILQRDLGSAVIVFSFAIVVLFFAGLKWWAVAVTGLSAAALGLYFAWIEPYRWERITTFLHPTQDTDDTAYQVIRMLIACARGGIIGPGPGLNRDKWMALPVSHTDAIYCVIASELGFVGAATLTIVFLLFAWRVMDLARRQPDRFSMVLLASLGTCIVLQAFINMGVATGCLPCTGLPLPFISAGGSSLLITLCMSGLILSLSRQATPDEREEEAVWRPV
ncbi:MAG: FtsW/RodA/SpoVE family cell cycle protein [Candidatus Zipacnadales bacterium]